MSERSECENCDDLGWQWEDGLGGESWKVPCRRWCRFAQAWMEAEYGTPAPSSTQQGDEK